MGYYTRFEISVTPHHMADDVMDRLCEVSGYNFDESIKWYEHQEDLVKVSREFPNVYITVDGYGEEVGDIWRAYVHNGEYVRHDATITFPNPPF